MGTFDKTTMGLAGAFGLAGLAAGFVIKKVQQHLDEPIEQAKQTIQSAIDSEDYDTAIQHYNDLVQKYGNTNDSELSTYFRYTRLALLEGPYYKCAKTDAERAEQYYDDILTQLDEIIGITQSESDEYYNLLLKKGRIVHSPSQSRRLIIKAMQSSNLHIKNQAKKLYTDLTDYLFREFFNRNLYLQKDIASIDPKLNDKERQEEIDLLTLMAENDKFTNREKYSDRQFIFIVRSVDQIAGCYDETENIRWVFTLDQIPHDIQFPTGHPLVNTLYIGHPTRPTVYLPFQGSEDKLFHEKVNELRHLLQCLGATEISFKAMKGRSISRQMSSSSQTDGNAGGKGANVSGGYGQKDRREEESSSQHNNEVMVEFAPKQKPYCPDDLVWMSSDEEWKRLVKQRLEGNMLSYTQRISSSETCRLSTSKVLDIKGAFDNMMMNVSCNFNSEADNTFSQSEETEWEITAKFKPLDEFEDENPSSPIPTQDNTIKQELSDNEQKYLEEIMFYMEDDGEITEDERIMLNRKRMKFGISEERAADIEQMCRPQLKDEEKEYIETFKELSSNGEITERTRRMLERERESLGITKERADTLERM